jgi:hypothetical protein
MPSVSLLVLSVVEAPRGGWKIPVSDVLSKVVATAGTDCRDGIGLSSMLLSDIARGRKPSPVKRIGVSSQCSTPEGSWTSSCVLLIHTRGCLQARARCNAAGDNLRREPRKLP